MRTDGRTEVTKLTVAVRNFAKEPKNARARARARTHTQTNAPGSIRTHDPTAREIKDSTRLSTATAVCITGRKN
jgi:hypothetical protein